VVDDTATTRQPRWPPRATGSSSRSSRSSDTAGSTSFHTRCKPFEVSPHHSHGSIGEDPLFSLHFAPPVFDSVWPLLVKPVSLVCTFPFARSRIPFALRPSSARLIEFLFPSSRRFLSLRLRLQALLARSVRSRFAQPRSSTACTASPPSLFTLQNPAVARIALAAGVRSAWWPVSAVSFLGLHSRQAESRCLRALSIHHSTPMRSSAQEANDLNQVPVARAPGQHAYVGARRRRVSPLLVLWLTCEPDSTGRVTPRSFAPVSVLDVNREVSKKIRRALSHPPLSSALPASTIWLSAPGSVLGEPVPPSPQQSPVTIGAPSRALDGADSSSDGLEDLAISGNGPFSRSRTPLEHWASYALM